ncbi:hypothetical protein ACX3YG_14470 [Pseudomonas wadenswilerensis]
MSTFAVFGMTADVALAEARKTTKTTRPNPKPNAPPLELSVGDWNLAVQERADKIMRSDKVRQLSQMFDAPQYAEQFIALMRKQCVCRDLKIRAKAILTDAKGKPIINAKTKAPKVGWIDYAQSANAA